MREDKNERVDTTRWGKLIQLELRKEIKFDHVNKWYVQNPESILENETHYILCDFEIPTDHVISARRLDLVIDSKKREPTE